MEINNLQQQYLFVYLSCNSSFLVKFRQLGQVWLFNCFEGCQHVLAKKKVRISQIKNIVITNSSINNISGLLGLLSSISLNTKIRRIDIYGPKELKKYIFWGRRYSQTNFRYKLYIHNFSEGLISRQFNLILYAFMHSYKYRMINYCIMIFEEPSTFNSKVAIKYKIPFGPLYGYFKVGKNFILPDGLIFYSKNFICGYYLGSKVVFIHKNFHITNKKFIKNSTCVLYY